MSHLLYIKASPKPSPFSNTLLLGDEFIRTYRSFHPEDSITILDLYQFGINFLSCDAVTAVGKEKSELTPEQITALEHVLTHVDQFISADKYVIASPMWNLGIPAILKAYIDNIMMPDKTFTFRDGHTTGLLLNRKMVHITSQGQQYDVGLASNTNYDFSDRYLRTIFKRMGITDVISIILDGTLVHDPATKEQKLNQALHEVRKLAINY